MTPASFVREHQQLWANRHSHAIPFQLERAGYVTEREMNLFQPLSKEVYDQFYKADGGELKASTTRPAKMCALHSSSALAVNVFHYWRDKDKTLLAKAMEIPSGNLVSLDFEKKLPIAETVDRNRFPIDPNLDVLLGYQGNAAVEYVGIESKFSEAYGLHDGLKQAYLDDSSLWEGLSNCLDFAKSIAQPEKVDGLNTPQLLKHLLGLRLKSKGKPFRLMYLWYAAFGPELGQHYRQLEAFKKVLEEDGLQFQYLTYQELICRLASNVRPQHQAYADYLAGRYL